MGCSRESFHTPKGQQLCKCVLCHAALNKHLRVWVGAVPCRKDTGNGLAGFMTRRVCLRPLAAPRHWGKHYRLMGDWRLSFMPRFARDMGHR